MACFNEDDFELIDGTHLSPKAYTQLRRVAVATKNDVSLVLNARGGNQAQTLGADLQVAWTNPGSDPYPQRVYAEITRGGTRVAAQARSVIYVETLFGAVVGVAPADPTPSTVWGQFGNGGDMGSVSSQTVFMNVEAHQDERTALIGTTELVAPGSTYKLRVRLRLDALFWESQVFQGGDNETDLSLSTGATSLALFAYPEF